jgi:hypothetical protein
MTADTSLSSGTPRLLLPGLRLLDGSGFAATVGVLVTVRWLQLSKLAAREPRAVGDRYLGSSLINQIYYFALSYP